MVETRKPQKPVRYMDFIGPSRTVSKKAADPLVSRPKTRSVATPIKPVEKPKPAPKPVKKPVEKPIEKPVEHSSPAPSSSDSVAKKASAALSGTDTKSSPFLKNYSIDKRPLSNSVPKKSDSHFEKISFLGVSDASPERKLEKNVYEKPAKDKKKSKHEKSPVKIIDNSKKSSGLPLVIIILLTIVLGAAVGAGIYFILPK